MNRKSLVPNGLTFMRFILALVIIYGIINQFFLCSVLLLVIAVLTDFLDGYIARRMGATSDRGAYLDVTADFVLVILCFVAFVLLGWYDPLILALIVVVFLLFMISSGFDRPVYDPLGRYIGTFLMGMIFITLLWPEIIIREILLLLLVFYCLSSVTTRIYYFMR